MRPRGPTMVNPVASQASGRRDSPPYGPWRDACSGVPAPLLAAYLQNIRRCPPGLYPHIGARHCTCPLPARSGHRTSALALGHVPDVVARTNSARAAICCAGLMGASRSLQAFLEWAQRYLKQFDSLRRGRHALLDEEISKPVPRAGSVTIRRSRAMRLIGIGLSPAARAPVPAKSPSRPRLMLEARPG